MLRRLVTYNFWPNLIKNVIQAGFICNIYMIETCLRIEVGLFTAAFIPQVIHNSDRVSRCYTLIDDVRPNKAGSTGH